MHPPGMRRGSPDTPESFLPFQLAQALAALPPIGSEKEPHAYTVRSTELLADEILETWANRKIPSNNEIERRGVTEGGAD